MFVHSLYFLGCFLLAEMRVDLVLLTMLGLWPQNCGAGCVDGDNGFEVQNGSLLEVTTVVQGGGNVCLSLFCDVMSLLWRCCD